MFKQFLSAAALTVALAGAAQAAPVTVTSATGTGEFNNSPDLLTDGDFGLGTWWTDENNVWWTDQEGAHGVVLTLAFDQVYSLTDVNIGVDNNDYYVVQTSTNGTTWHTLFLSLDTELDPGYVRDGFSMIMRTSIEGEEGYSELIDFSPVNAAYARIYALTGDASYAVSELQFFGAPVPVPASLFLLAPAVAALGLRRRRV